jgi:acyl-CoA reductase-like NAD-dependent aldehyde dehydrogenase
LIQLFYGGRIYVERPLETGAGIDRSLNSAQRAQPAWGSLPLPIRCEILGDAVDAFVAKRSEIAAEINWQMGRPISHSPGEVRGFEERARHMLSTAPPEFVALERGDETASRRQIKRVPLGVVAVVARSDANLAQAIVTLTDGAFFNPGESRCGIKRIYVAASRFEDFVAGFVDLTKKYRLGSPLDPETTLGPVVRTAVADAVRSQVRDAVAHGARQLIDERLFGASAAGTPYLAPQVLVGVDHSMAIMRELGSRVRGAIARCRAWILSCSPGRSPITSG